MKSYVSPLTIFLCVANFVFVTLAQAKTIPVAPHLAEKTIFAANFGEPTDLDFSVRTLTMALGPGSSGAMDIPDGIIVVDAKKGEIVRLSEYEGVRLNVIARDLKSPTQLMRSQDAFFVTERGANRIIRIDRDGKVTPFGNELSEPTQIFGAGTDIKVLSQENSQIYQRRFYEEPLENVLRDVPPGLNKEKMKAKIAELYMWRPTYPGSELQPARHTIRALLQDGDTLFFSAEDSIWMMSATGKTARFAAELGEPSAMAVGNDGLYVCDESNGGRLLKLDDQGDATVVATDLMRPCAILWTSIAPRTALVANREGFIWKLTF